MTTLISAEQLARECRRSPETIRRWARAGTIPSVGGGKGSDWQFDRVAVFEALIRDEVVQSLQNYLDDPALPTVIRNNIQTMIDGVQSGWLSVDQVGQLMHEMQA